MANLVDYGQYALRRRVSPRYPTREGVLICPCLKGGKCTFERKVVCCTVPWAGLVVCFLERYGFPYPSNRVLFFYFFTRVLLLHSYLFSKHSVRHVFTLAVSSSSSLEETIFLAMRTASGATPASLPCSVKVGSGPLQNGTSLLPSSSPTSSTFGVP